MNLYPAVAALFICFLTNAQPKDSVPVQRLRDSSMATIIIRNATDINLYVEIANVHGFWNFGDTLDAYLVRFIPRIGGYLFRPADGSSLGIEVPIDESAGEITSGVWVLDLSRNPALRGIQHRLRPWVLKDGIPQYTTLDLKQAHK